MCPETAVLQAPRSVILFWKAFSFSAYTVTPPHITDPLSSLLCSQASITGPCPKPDQTSTKLPIPFHMHRNTFPHVLLGLPSDLFLSGFPPKSLCICLLPIPATCRAHLIHFYLITRKILDERYKSEKLLVIDFSPVPSSPLLVPNVLLGTVFSDAHSLCFSRNMRIQVSHPHKTTGKVMR